MIQARFLDRPNRFVARVHMDGQEVDVHLPNTGRLAFLTPGLTCLLRKSENKSRKTAYDLFAVVLPSGETVVIDSLAPNRAARQCLSEHPQWLDLLKPVFIKPEARLGDSRLDFLVTCSDKTTAIEVKGTTWCVSGVGYFPDAMSTRATRHVRNLMELKAQGYDAVLLFVSARSDVQEIRPAMDVDPDFCHALQEAKAAGVRLVGIRAGFDDFDLAPLGPIPVHLSSISKTRFSN